MGSIRQPVGTPPGWLWVILAVAAMGISLGHTVADLGIIFGSLSSSFGVPQSLLSVLIGALYTWWAWVFAKAVGGAKSWLVGLMVFDILWVGGNGLTILACPPPCSAVPVYADLLHRPDGERPYAGGLRAGAHGLEAVAGEVPEQPLCHLRSRGVVGT